VVIPPAIQVEVNVERPDGATQLNFAQLFLPGILFMSFLFIAQGMSVDIWEEKRRGTLCRTLTTPQSAYRLLAGKLAAGAVLMAAIGFVALLASIAFFDIGWRRVPLALVWCVFAGTTLIAFMMLLQTFAGGQRGGEMLSNLVVMPLMMIGGSFFPFEAMPAWMAAIGQWTPNGLAVLRLKDLLYGAPSTAALLVAVLGIGVPAVAAFALTGRRLGGRFAAG
jgi:ABC-type multidrug transport system permease subunit